MSSPSSTKYRFFFLHRLLAAIGSTQPQCCILPFVLILIDLVFPLYTILKVPENIDGIYKKYRFYRYSQGLLGLSWKHRIEAAKPLTILCSAIFHVRYCTVKCTIRKMGGKNRSKDRKTLYFLFYVLYYKRIFLHEVHLLGNKPVQAYSKK